MSLADKKHEEFLRRCGIDEICTFHEENYDSWCITAYEARKYLWRPAVKAYCKYPIFPYSCLAPSFIQKGTARLLRRFHMYKLM